MIEYSFSTVAKRMLVLASALITAGTGFAAPVFVSGDLFVATQSGRIQWRDSIGANYSPSRVINTADFGEQAGMRHSPQTGNLWVTNFNSGGSPDGVRIVNTSGVPLGTLATPLQLNPESVVFDAVGNAYVGGPNGALVKLNPLGAVTANFTVPLTAGAAGPDWIDLAADQRTLFYSYERQIIKRFDVGSGAPLADFADLSGVMAPGERSYALRLLPDGGVLIAAGKAVYRLNSMGTVIQTYDAPGEDFFFSLALTADCLSFWTGSLGNSLGEYEVYEFNIASGLMEHSFNAGLPVGGLAVFGDYGVAGSAWVPEPGTLALVGVAFTAFFISRRHKANT